ncbi:LysM peptidoglycan-binding domain-containing protein [Gottfriedia acidiceleris]|uniref:LysM peptidoglycan-binding domain-containing protein n=1 Tax=Gottfriedia acidiceleris TaxID=371036 RepID=UPI000B43C979|nr:LysM peptidoglycan-binding domain-containing protein [Gottfriedia acidiceleris]
MNNELQNNSIADLSRKNKNKKLKNKKINNQKKEVDLLNLPPRSETMKIKEDQRRPWWKIKYPLITALVIIFIMLPFGVVKFVHSKYDKIFTEKGSLIIPSNKFEKVELADTNNLKKHKKQNSSQKTAPIKKELKNEAKPQTDSSKTVGVEEINHEVKRGETLFTISMKYYGNRDGEEIIQDANHLKGIEVKPGQILKIPLNIDVDK